MRTRAGIVVVCTTLAACATTASREQAEAEEAEHPLVAVAPEMTTGARVLPELIEGLTQGRVTFAVETEEALCSRPADDCLAALQAGDIDLYRVPSHRITELFPELQVLEVPYLIESSEVAELVFNGAFFARMRDALLERTGLRLMAVSNDGGWRHVANREREVRTPADVAGLTLTTLDVPIHLETTQALGATPVTDTWEAPTGPWQGIRTSVSELLDRDAEARLPFVTIDRHNYMVALWLMNEQRYQRMPADLQQIVQLGFDELRRLTLGFPDAREAEAFAAFEAVGGRVYVPTDEERRAFVMAAGRVSTWFMDTYGYEWLVWFEGAIAEAERELASSR